MSQGPLACPCGNNDPVKFRRFQDNNGALLGVSCEKCNNEWLAKEFVEEPNGESLKLDGVNYHKRENTAHATNPSQQAPGRFEVVPSDDDYVPKAGDHVMWQRHYYIFHHAIVVSVDNKKVTLCHWKKVDSGFLIVEEVISLAKCLKDMYIVKYTEEELRSNPPQLVLSRARSRIGDDDYSICYNNCEDFATFCKTGIHQSQQRKHEKNVFWKVLLKAGAKSLVPVVAETIEAVTLKKVPKDVWKLVTNTKTQMIGAGIVIILEGVLCIYDISKLFEQYKSGEKTRNVFVEESIQRVTECLCSAGGIIAGGFIGEFIGAHIGSFLCPGKGTLVGYWIGGIVGGIIGGLVGHYLGSILGRYIGKGIVSSFKSNDRRVRNNDIKIGDQLVFYASFFHPRCHVVVMGTDLTNKSVTVIRKVYKKGIVMETLNVTDNMYKVGYRDGTVLYSVEDRIRRAQRALTLQSPASYDIIFNNCKHFAYYIVVKSWGE